MVRAGSAACFMSVCIALYCTAGLCATSFQKDTADVMHLLVFVYLVHFSTAALLIIAIENVLLFGINEVCSSKSNEVKSVRKDDGKAHDSKVSNVIMVVDSAAAKENNLMPEPTAPAAGTAVSTACG